MKKIWIEYLRVIAVIAVIAVITIHATTSIYNNFGHIQSHNWWLANLLNVSSRFAVPVFIMISGCVLLGKNVDTRFFYISRGTRLIPAIIFWSLFYLIFDYIYNDIELKNIIWRLKFGIFISGSTYYHLWYLSMFTCLMLFAPFINNYIIGKKPSMEDFIFLISIFALFMLLNQISFFSNESLGISIGWFKLFPWYFGYFIMGYFIDVYIDKIKIKNQTTVAFIIVIILTITILNFYSASTLKIVKDTFIIHNSGIFDFILSFFIFYFFSKNRAHFKDNHIISNISSKTFGIYLIHSVFLTVFSKHIILTEETFIYLPLLIIITFISSYLTILTFTKLKWFKAVC